MISRKYFKGIEYFSVIFDELVKYFMINKIADAITTYILKCSFKAEAKIWLVSVYLLI